MILTDHHPRQQEPIRLITPGYLVLSATSTPSWVPMLSMEIVQSLRHENRVRLGRRVLISESDLTQLMDAPRRHDVGQPVPGSSPCSP